MSSTRLRRPTRLLAALGLLLAAQLAGSCSAAAEERPAVIAFPSAGKPRLVSGKLMRELHEQVKTPCKYGVVLPAGPGEVLDWFEGCSFDTNCFRQNMNIALGQARRYSRDTRAKIVVAAVAVGALGYFLFGGR